MKINGTKIRLLRKSKQLTIKELADSLDLSSSAIGMYERGMRTPDLETIVALSTFFEVDVMYFIEGVKSKANFIPKSNYQSLSVTELSSAIIRKKVMNRSKGICELCNQMAPFIQLNGEPYLESYILEKNLNFEELQSENVVAVCPNCKKKLEILNLPGDHLFLKNKIKNITSQSKEQ